jgi:hypothetical protein
MTNEKEITENTEVTEITEAPTDQQKAVGVSPEVVENQGENTGEMVEKDGENEKAVGVSISEETMSQPERISSKHFKRANQEKELLKRQNEELIRQLEAQRYAQSGQTQQTQPKELDDFIIDENNFAEGKDLKRMYNEMQTLKQELHQYKQKTALEVTEEKLNREYPDFNKVFTDDNIELFKAEHPDIAESLLNSNAEPYKVAKSVYKAMKQFGIYAEEPTRKVTQDRERVQSNLSKPRTVSSVTARQGNSPLSRAGEYADDELTEERKAALRAEVERYSR